MTPRADDEINVKSSFVRKRASSLGTSRPACKQFSVSAASSCVVAFSGGGCSSTHWTRRWTSTSSWARYRPGPPRPRGRGSPATPGCHLRFPCRRRHSGGPFRKLVTYLLLLVWRTLVWCMCIIPCARIAIPPSPFRSPPWKPSSLINLRLGFSLFLLGSRVEDAVSMSSWDGHMAT